MTWVPQVWEAGDTGAAASLYAEARCGPEAQDAFRVDDCAEDLVVEGRFADILQREYSPGGIHVSQLLRLYCAQHGRVDFAQICRLRADARGLPRQASTGASE